MPKRLFWGVILFLGGCVGIFMWMSFPIPENRTPPQEKPAVEQSADKGADDPLTIFRFPLEDVQVSVEYSPQAQSVSAWHTGTEDELVFNAAYFLEDYTPAGFLVASSTVVSTRQFDQDKTGLLAIWEDTVEILNTKERPFSSEELFVGAVQSYPFLIKNGQASIAEDSGMVARRTAIGISEQEFFVFVVTSTQISLYELGQEIEERQLPVTHVLNLDGGPSTGIVGHWDGVKWNSNSYTPVSSIIRIQKEDAT